MCDAIVKEMIISFSLDTFERTGVQVYKQPVSVNLLHS